MKLLFRPILCIMGLLAVCNMNAAEQDYVDKKSPEYYAYLFVYNYPEYRKIVTEAHNAKGPYPFLSQESFQVAIRSSQFKKHRQELEQYVQEHATVAICNALSCQILVRYARRKSAQDQTVATRKRVILPGEKQRFSRLTTHGVSWRALKKCPDECDRKDSHMHFGRCCDITAAELSKPLIRIAAVRNKFARKK